MNLRLVEAGDALEFVDTAEIQNGYGIIDRQDDEMVDFARAHEIAFVPFFPLGSAFAVAHLEENVGALEVELDATDLAVLDRVGQRDDAAD